MKNPLRLFRRTSKDESLNAELDACLEILIAEKISEGLPREEAARRARLELGGRTQITECVRDVKTLVWLSLLVDDFRFATRSLVRQPALAVTVVCTIALAVAANGALFTIFDGLLFKPLPYKDPDRVVSIELPDGWTQPLLERLQTSTLFTELGAGMRFRSTSYLEEGSEAVAEWGLFPSETWQENFPLFGVSPLIGRWLSDEDFSVTSPLPAMIGEDLWRTRFGADPSLVGQVIHLPGLRPEYGGLLLVGVMPRRFNIPLGANVWALIWPSPGYTATGYRGFPSYGRLTSGVTLAQARAAFPELQLRQLRDRLQPRGAAALTMLLTATGLLLVVAWVQVAALLFARTAGRATELGIRLALGASRSTIIRQCAVEGAVIAAAALGIATAATPPLTASLVRVLPPELTVGQVLLPDLRTFVFAAMLSSLGILIVGLVPLELLRRSSPLALLRGALLGPVHISAARMRTALLVGQLSVTTMLLYMAGLATHSFTRVASADFGFEPKNVVAFSLPPSTSTATVNEIFQALPNLPGVRAAGGGQRVPFVDIKYLAPTFPTVKVDPPGQPRPNAIRAVRTFVSPGYFTALGVPLREGRLPTPGEFQTSVVVNATLARHLQAFGPVIGQRVHGWVNEVNSWTFDVAGVVEDLVRLHPDDPPLDEIFWFRTASANRSFVVRIDPAGTASVAAIRDLLDRYYPGQPKRLVYLEDAAALATTDYRARSTILGLIATLCLPFAAAGIVGALLYGVSQQAREIGIRLALGAEATDIRRRIVSRALRVVSISLTIGLVGALAVGRWMSAYLFGISPVDPLTIGSVAVALIIVAWLSALWPAYRASTIDPAVVLRES